MLSAVVGEDGDLGFEGEMLELARHPALDDGGVGVGIGKGFEQPCLDLADALGMIADRTAIGVQHDIGIQAEAVGGGDHPGVLNAQVELVHGRGGHREQVVLLRRIEEYLGGTFEFALGGFLDQHQRAAVLGMLHDGLGMPGDIAGGVAQEVIIAQLRPERFGVLLVNAAAHQDVHRGMLGVGNQLRAVGRIVQPAPQGALGLGIQLTQQRGPPGVPHVGVGGIDIGDGQHIEIIQAHLVAQLHGKIVDHLRVGDVLALGGSGHQ